MLVPSCSQATLQDKTLPYFENKLWISSAEQLGESPSRIREFSLERGGREKKRWREREERGRKRGEEERNDGVNKGVKNDGEGGRGRKGEEGNYWEPC